MRILLAEDDRIIADGLGRSLRQSGYAVDWVANGADADHALASGSYDLVILDLGLPKLPGLDVLRRLRKASHPRRPAHTRAYDGRMGLGGRIGVVQDAAIARANRKTNGKNGEEHPVQ